MRTLNLGILAHVDAGKTSLTERLLFEAGVIDRIGSVDRGDTRTDTLELERERGITIRAAVVAFTVGEVAVNLIDTPGHPDFIAEVERVLDVLDGVVLVVSAVEGVQAQTRILYRALQRLGLPTILFVNKIDRRGARDAGLLDELRARLTPAILPLARVHHIGERSARVEAIDFADASDQLDLLDVLGDYQPALQDDVLASPGSLHADAVRSAACAASRAGLAHPVLFGSAITGVGVRMLHDALPSLLLARAADEQGELSGTVFKIERDQGGARVAYVALRAGSITPRARISVAGVTRRVTAIECFDGGRCSAATQLSAGHIGKLHGLGAVRIGDTIGSGATPAQQAHFAPPTLQTGVRPRDPAASRRMHDALAQLAEQDPLIGLRHDDARHETWLTLYGEMQKEVIAETLRRDYGVEVTFAASTPLYVERPSGVGFARIGPPYPFVALAALRVEPAPAGSGITLIPEIDYGVLPMAFHLAVETAIRDTLQQGLDGWPVIDCAVYITESISYTHWATSTPADHRLLTPLVVMRALEAAGTAVCEPVQHFVLQAPADCANGLLALLGRLGAALESPAQRGTDIEFTGELAADRVIALQRQLPALSRGEGILHSAFARYRPVTAERPRRARLGPDARDLKTYLMQLRRS